MGMQPPEIPCSCTLFRPIQERALRSNLPRMLLFACILCCQCAFAQTKPRARDLGVPFEGTAGPLNAITDVQGVEVGHTTLISGEGPLKVGVGPVRTGVTAVDRKSTRLNSSHLVISYAVFCL